MTIRTREQWNTEIDAYAGVAGLSLSAVAAWKLLRDLCVSIAMFFEGILDIFRKDVDHQLATKQFGALYWYVAMAKEFQEGDSLTVDNGIVKYDPVNETHRIVTQASARETTDGILVLKVAKTVAGELEALSSTELGDFRNYVAARRSPGVRMSIASIAPDIVKYAIYARFDPLYDHDEVENGLETALLYFRDNFRFDAVLYVSELVAALSDVPGVISIDLSLCLWNTETLAFDAISVSKELPAGYFNWNNTNILSVLPPED